MPSGQCNRRFTEVWRPLVTAARLQGVSTTGGMLQLSPGKWVLPRPSSMMDRVPRGVFPTTWDLAQTLELRSRTPQGCEPDLQVQIVLLVDTLAHC